MHRNYIGTKIIQAFPESKGPLPQGQPGYAVIYPDGYRSWSPAAVFEEAYRAIEGDGQALTFGDALHMLKLGKKVARAGWNGKGMFIYLNKGSVDGELLGFLPGAQPTPAHPSTQDGIRLGLFNCGDSGTTVRLPNINMRSASGATVTGWLASQTDMLAEDWQVVE